jgi:thiosulfate dehydrogenase (quinone) large subunit
MTMLRTRSEVQMPAVERETRQSRALHTVLGVLRLLIGFEFVWAFADKTFGLGFATAKADAWVNGGNPTAGALWFALKGPFKGFYQNITGASATFAANGDPIKLVAPHAWVTYVYMGAMLLIGLGLMTGVMTRLAALGGIAWMAIFYTATAIWPDNNPFFDQHILSIVALTAIIIANAGLYVGLGKIWQRFDLVKKHPILT